MDYKNFDCSLLIDKPSPKPFSESSSLNSLLNTHLITAERVDKILEDEIITTNWWNSQVFDPLKKKAPTVDSWLDQYDL